MNFELKIREGKLAGYKKTVTKTGRILIGRDASCDFAIDDPLLSRQHCLIEVSENQVKLIDLKSRNGTYLNGKKIEEEILKFNDEIKLGKHIVTLLPLQKQTATPVLGNLCNRCGRELKQDDVAFLKATNYTGTPYCKLCIAQTIESRKARSKVPLEGRDTRDEIRATGMPISPSLANRGLGGSFSQPKVTKKITSDEMTIPLANVSLPPGTPSNIGHYQVLEVLGEGGMGFVYKAQHSFLETIVAIKVIKEELAAQPDILKRFVQEAKLGVSLDHPNILKIHDAGESDGIFFISMEYFPGQDITNLMKTQKSIPVPISLKWAICMADALSYAHKKGVIHRDVKPSNILVNDKEEVKLADFGLAKAWQKAGANQLTASGQMLGTIQYISPEQLENSKNVDPKTDIFSLGASIYYTLAGYPPFGQEPLGKVIQNILHSAPAPLQRKDIPKSFIQVLMKAMAKKVEERFASMEELKIALQKVAGEINS